MSTRLWLLYKKKHSETETASKEEQVKTKLSME